MATIKQLRRRIRSAKNIQQITRAMKLVAAARLRRAQERVLESRAYAAKMRELMANLASGGDLPGHPLLQRRRIEKYAVVLFTAERGLAGSFNTNLIRRAGDFMSGTEGDRAMIAVGRKGSQFFGKRGHEIVHTFNIPTSGPTMEHARAVTMKAQEMFESGAVDAIHLVYSRFYSAIRQVPEIVQLFPVEPPSVEQSAEPSGFLKTYQFEPSPQELLAELLPRYALTNVLQALFESNASEHGARMTAMTSATDNAGEMIEHLTLQANRMRQASITKEILEVVGGAEALKG